MAESELFSFNTGGKKPSLKQLSGGDKPSSSALAPKVHTVSVSSDSSSGGSGYSSDEDGTRRRRKRRGLHRRAPHRPPLGKEGSIKSRLMHIKPVTIELEDSDDDLISPTKKSKPDAGNGRDGSSSPSLSPSPSPCPSPPQQAGFLSTPDDKKSRKTLDKANSVLNMLRWSGPSAATFSDNSYSDTSIVIDTPPTTAGHTLTLRVRCKGKVHKFNVYKCRSVLACCSQSVMLPVHLSHIRYPCPHQVMHNGRGQIVNVVQRDPLSGMCTQLATRVGAESGDHLLLSLKNSTIKQTESPESLGLTTASIIDAVVMTQSVTECPPSASGGSGEGGTGTSITIKVQSSDKSIVYSLSKSDPLQKAMTAFASALGVSITKLKFMFDGDPINPTQTAADLDMENDDCIDVAMVA